MNYIYSAAHNYFYPVILKSDYENSGRWPSDGVPIADAVFNKFSCAAPGGKMRGTGNDGFPCWIDVPPPTADEFIAHAETEKQRLLVLANAAITPLSDAVELEIATADEINLYAKWRKYRVLLNRVDTDIAPNIEWPIIPA